MLEIGLGLGGGVLFWQKCFPKAEHIICVTKNELPDKNIEMPKDVLPLHTVNGNQRHKRSEDGIVEIYRDDAYNDVWLKRLLETGLRFNIIVDDGPHTLETWRYFLTNYLAFLRPGGIAIIEDVGVNEAKGLEQWYKAQGNGGKLSVIEKNDETRFETGECLVIWKER